MTSPHIPRLVHRWLLRARAVAVGLAAGGLLSACISGVDGIHPYELAVGDCFDDRWTDPQGRMILRVRPAPCDEAHQNEVTAQVSVPGGEEYPPRQVFLDLIDEECPKAFEAYVGLPQEQTDLVSSAQYPSRDAWVLGHHVLICFLRADDGSPLVRSYREGA